MRIRRTETLTALLAQEDTDGSNTITVDDTGPKSFTVKGEDGDTLQMDGIYYLVNLLQEIWLGNEVLEPGKVLMKPLERADCPMQNHYWHTLSRRMDADNTLTVLSDEKRGSDKVYLHIPAADTDGLAYYRSVSAAYPQIEIVELPAPPFSDGLLTKIDRKPGLLALKYNSESGSPLPYVVPDGRFNEMYGWDSYFIGLGLMTHDRYDLAKGMLKNAAYQIKYHGKMLSANRSYYLTRSQPPLYTPCLSAFYRRYRDRLPESWLGEHLDIAIDGYLDAWVNPQTHLFADIGLNRYFNEGRGRPKETETGHFDFILNRFATRHGISAQELEQTCDGGGIQGSELDHYFVHDCAMRENGHDTTTRLDDVCADTACVGLDAILYRVETDIAALLDDYYSQGFTRNGEIHTAAGWWEKAQARRRAVRQYLWSEEHGAFYDYNVSRGSQNHFVPATNLFPLWAGLCSREQAEKTVKSQFSALLCRSGIASTAPISAEISGPERQWDYPYGWAPHQILIWEGLERYGFKEEMQRATFAWVGMIIRATVEYNGLISEKFNAEKGSHRTDVEYGNVGAIFDYVPQDGFGWTNALLVLGIARLTDAREAELDALVDKV